MRPASRMQAYAELHGPAPLFRAPQRRGAAGAARAAPKGLADEAEANAKTELVRALVRSSVRAETIRDLSSRIEHAVADLPDGRIVMSFPRAGRICAAQILAELGDVRERFQTDAQLAPRPVSAPSPTPPERAAASSSDGPATTACAPPSPAGPTTPATAPWAADVYRRREGADATTRTPSASSRAPGSASSGAPGQTANPTIPRPTPQPRPSPQQHEVDTGCLTGARPHPGRAAARGRSRPPTRARRRRSAPSRARPPRRARARRTR